METIQPILDFIGTGLYWVMIPVGPFFLIKNIISGMMDLMIEFIMWRTIDIGTGILWTLGKILKLVKFPFVYLKRLLEVRSRRKQEEGSPSPCSTST